MPAVLNWLFLQVYYPSTSVTAHWIKAKKCLPLHFYMSSVLPQLMKIIIIINIIIILHGLGRLTCSGILLMNTTGSINILKLAYFSKILYYSVFVGIPVTSRSRSVTDTNCQSRNKIPVKICCPVSFSTYLEMATDTVHVAQKPSASGVGAVAPIPYWYWRKGTTHALRWENNKWRDPEVFHCLHHSTYDNVIFITKMTLKPQNKRHLMFSLRPRRTRNAFSYQLLTAQLTWPQNNGW